MQVGVQCTRGVADCCPQHKLLPTKSARNRQIVLVARNAEKFRLLNANCCYKLPLKACS